MQLYSSVCTHYPSGSPGPTAAAPAPPAAAAPTFKVSLQPPGAAGAAPEPETGECQPAAAAEHREAAAVPAAKMPAFSSCFEVVSGAAAPASAAAGPPGASCKPPLPPHYTSFPEPPRRGVGPKTPWGTFPMESDADVRLGEGARMVGKQRHSAGLVKDV